MTKYIGYLIKKNIMALICFAIFCSVLYVLPVLLDDLDGNNLHLLELMLVLSFIAVIIPIYMFKYKMNKRSIDMNFSLPITRTKILIAHFSVGLILLYSAYTIAFLLGLFIVATKVFNLNFIYYLYFYLATILPAFCIYAVSAFIFTRANNMIDGIISVIGALFLPALVVFVCEYLFARGYSKIYSGDFLYFEPLVRLQMIFKNAIVHGNVENMNISWLSAIIIWTILGVSSVVGIIMREKFCKAEDCGQISESLFCYKSQIPIYTILLIAMSMSMLHDFWLACMVIFVEFVLSIIYKRTIKIGWKFAIVFVSSIVFGILFSIICTSIFGPISIIPHK